MIRHHTAWLLLIFLCVFTLHALADVAVPPLEARVTDLTDTLSREQTARLEQTLADFETKKGSQIAVLIVPTTQPETIEQYSMRVVDTWKLGREGVDDGVLLLVAKADRTLRIETGYGLEGVLPDALARRIIDEVIAPGFKRGDFFGGLRSGIEQIIKVIEGEPLPAPARTGGQSAGADLVLENFIPILLILLVLGKTLQTMLGRMAGATITGTIAGFLIWLISSSLAVAALIAIAVFVISLFEQTGRIIHRGGYRGGYRGWPGGGGPGGGFGGGGFGGGGGGFGGGGASGRW